MQCEHCGKHLNSVIINVNNNNNGGIKAVNYSNNIKHESELFHLSLEKNLFALSFDLFTNGDENSKFKNDFQSTIRNVQYLSSVSNESNQNNANSASENKICKNCYAEIHECFKSLLKEEEERKMIPELKPLSKSDFETMKHLLEDNLERLNSEVVQSPPSSSDQQLKREKVHKSAVVELLEDIEREKNVISLKIQSVTEKIEKIRKANIFFDHFQINASNNIINRLFFGFHPSCSGIKEAVKEFNTAIGEVVLGFYSIRSAIPGRGLCDKMYLIPQGYESKIEVNNKTYNLSIQPSNLHDFNASFLQFITYVAHVYALFLSTRKHRNDALPLQTFVVEGNDVFLVSGVNKDLVNAAKLMQYHKYNGNFIWEYNNFPANWNWSDIGLNSQIAQPILRILEFMVNDQSP